MLVEAAVGSRKGEEAEEIMAGEGEEEMVEEVMEEEEIPGEGEMAGEVEEDEMEVVLQKVREWPEEWVVTESHQKDLQW